MKKVLVELKKISYINKNNNILNNINLKIFEGEKIALLGKSAAGKSTLISILNGTLEPTEGNIKIFSKDLKDLNKSQKRLIGTIWQDLRLIDNFSVEQNVNCGLLGSESLYFGISNILNICSFKKAHLCLKLCNVKPSIFPKSIDNLSGGQKQRVAIARSIIQEPEILFADEPFNNLDPNLASMIKDLFVLNQNISTFKFPRTILIALHRLDLLEGFNRIIGIKNGSILFDCKKDLLKNYHLESIY